MEYENTVGLSEQTTLLEPQELSAYVRRAQEEYGYIVEGDPAMTRVIEDIAIFSRMNIIMTILGEPGVGKEGAARLIHAFSEERGPFVAVNMAGISPSLIESELFGHVQGAFTNADDDREGRFEQISKGGTLFLDEIGDLPIEKQGVFLRVLAQRIFHRVGDNEEVGYSGRVVCATNADWENAVQLGKIRQDLHGRLSACTLQLPPFRTRTIEHRTALISHFVKCMEQEVKHPLRLSPEALQVLLAINDNNNNVREVENVIRRSAAYAACQNYSIEMHHVQRALRGSSSVESSPAQSASTIMKPLVEMHGLGDAMELVKRQVVRDALRRNCGNICQTANELRLDRHNLQRLLKNWDMKK